MGRSLEIRVWSDNICVESDNICVESDNICVESDIICIEFLFLYAPDTLHLFMRHGIISHPGVLAVGIPRH
jgi:hypothetical protein